MLKNIFQKCFSLMLNVKSNCVLSHHNSDNNSSHEKKQDINTAILYQTTQMHQPPSFTRTPFSSLTHSSSRHIFPFNKQI